MIGNDCLIKKVGY